MNKTLLAITMGAIVASAVGCKPSGDQSPSQQLDNIKAETKADAQEMKDYAYAQKDEFVTTMQARLDALNKDIDALSAKIDNSSDAVKADAKPKIQALRHDADVLNKQLDQARNATASTWDSVKAGFQTAFNSMKDDFQQARQWASDKIAP
jgi:chromosome segregation ATPase